MRLTAIFLLAACLQANARSYGQSITLSETNTSLLKVFKEIKKQSGYEFWYEDRLMQKAKLVSIHVRNAPLEQVLGLLFKEQALSYEIIGKTVAIREKETAVSGQLSPSPPVFLDIHGRVLNEKGEPVSGATVTVKGTRKAVVTNDNGEFSIQADKGQVLVISFVGYGPREVAVNENNANLSISLKIGNQVINEVVVTALGIKKERKALGYSVTEVKGEELTKAREVNVMSSLEGKVAGLNVSTVAGGPGASSNVIIRGVSSLSQTNQPLYVINGVPVESQPKGNMGTQYDNAPDQGDAIGNLNPDDIESVSVLKGAAATALYGYRGKAGVILITTKSAKSNSIDFNSNYVAERVVDPTNWQYVYGQGGNNHKPDSGLVAYNAGQYSYGAKLDGQPVAQFDGVTRPYVAQKSNLSRFYRTGGTFTNTVAFNRLFEGGAIRFAASDLTNKSIVPNSGLNRQSFNLTVNYSPFKNLTIDARANYILEQAKNRPFLSDGPGNSNFNVMFLPTSVDVNTLKKATNPDGTEFAYSNNAYATNPWFAAEKFINNTDRDRLISSVTVKYVFDNGLFVQGRVGRDAYTDTYTGVVPNGTAYRVNGSITVQSTKFTDMNVDGLAGITVKASDLSITPTVGASYRRTKTDATTNNGTTFAVPYVYNITNAIDKSVGLTPSDLEVQSIYGNVELDYKGALYLNGSLRNDWFSSLATPGRNNKLNVVYPSVSGSFVFSQVWRPGWLNFGKLRAGYAVVGQATDPYQTLLSYALYSPTLNGRPLGSISNTSVPNDALQASKASEVEVGTEMKLFNNLLSIDISAYLKKSRNEIVSAPASISSGYTGAVLNIGQLQNKGIEALVSITPVKSQHFSWTSSVNGSINANKVVALAAGQSSLPVGTSRTGNGFTQNIVGYAADQVVAFDYKYDAAGKIVVDGSGIPVSGDLKPFGSAYAKWIAGWNNELTYKRLSLSFLIDGKFGGKIFSATDYYGYLFGLHKATLVNREGTLGNNLTAQAYYAGLANNISKLFVKDASFIKLRQVVIGYSLPGKLFGNVVKGATISLVARNLFTLMKKTDNIDPEASYTAAAQGLELGGVPPTRTFGANLSFKL